MVVDDTRVSERLNIFVSVRRIRLCSQLPTSRRLGLGSKKWRCGLVFAVVSAEDRRAGPARFPRGETTAGYNKKIRKIIMAEDQELNASELGTLEYWEKIYDQEINNFKDHGDVGEVWFGKHNAQKVVRCISEQLDVSPTDKIIDIGCGNGWTLVELNKEGFTDLTGVDYSQKAVDLASEVLRDNKIDLTRVRLMVCDILDTENSPLPKDFKLVHDKGTYDAISLSPVDPQGHRTKYIANVHSILLPGGYLVISSCNWTKDELITHFKNDFEVVRTLHTPAFSFGGKVGESLSGVVFRKKQ